MKKLTMGQERRLNPKLVIRGAVLVATVPTMLLALWALLSGRYSIEIPVIMMIGSCAVLLLGWALSYRVNRLPSAVRTGIFIGCLLLGAAGLIGEFSFGLFDSQSAGSYVRIVMSLCNIALFFLGMKQHQKL